MTRTTPKPDKPQEGTAAMLETEQKIQRLLTTATDEAARAADSAERSGLLEGVAAELYSERRRRAAWFKEGLFWEPAWDLLLYLFDAHESGRPSVSFERARRACAAVSPTSARRWIDLLATHDYVAQRFLPGRAEPVELRLTAKGIEVMTGYLADARLLARMP